MTSAEIRSAFIDFFASKGHQIVPSAPIVVKNDPTLMFTNAGMNQFKDYFLGNRPAPHPRIADTQKCLRVSGKHNDLEEVGVDTYHHTMFEMLGNWSFGDYFKKEAIEWSWELLTTVLNIPKDRLYVTVFEGDAKEGLPKDDEAAGEWKKWIAEDRILLGNKKDNFWEMGDTGPCGPCTEIHVDTRPDEERKGVDGKTLVNADHPQVIEIWNNVFIQFNRLKDGSLQQLPAKHVDTGMGFERLVRVLQGKQSNYDTDVFTGTIAKIQEITKNECRGTDTKSDIAFRVLADHIRAISFTIADGQLPSNTGAGYVIRRILRRAVRYYYSYLNYQQPLLYQLLPVISTQFETVFPELKSQEAFVTKVIREEEEAFLRTLAKGLNRLDAYITPVEHVGTGGTFNTREDVDSRKVISDEGSYSSQKNEKIISGPVAFELYDTYGFPLDLTKLIASEQGWTIDEEAFTAEMQKQKDRSRAATAIDTEDWIVVNEGNSNEFVGYDSLETKAAVLKYRKVKAKGKEAYQIVLDKTPFYAESGGQVGDTGQLTIGNEQVAIVDTKKENDLIIHFTEKLPSTLEGEVIAKVDSAKRHSTAIHHSATHLLHAALRKVLGTHVAQKGSLVNADYLRFDFSHFSKMTDEEIKEVERLVNEKIRENIPVVIRTLPKEEAVQSGAMALFGEKYGDFVRVVTIDPSYSIELCGGTHVGATGELGFFKIKSEAAVAAGVRRIEALSGLTAENYIQEQFLTVRVIREALKNPKDLNKAIVSLYDENAALKKQLEKFEAAQIKTLRDTLLQKAEIINGAHFIGEVVEVSSADALKKLAFELKATLPNHVISLAAAIDGKASVVLLFDDAIAAEKGLDAAALIKQKISPLIKGGGGGQKTLATAGGQDSSNLRQVITTVKAGL
ncbi:MAG TPA: alanine--tRNA ligase [Flavisolibacter sp.]|nr:alanine--tRNA ligase [Flavisolibacter sp.]